MPTRLHRYYGSGHFHFITTSCYHRRPLLRSPRRRDFLLKILEQVRKRYGFIVVGYVLMPEHIHLLISEPDRGTPSTVMQVLKHRFARRLLGEWRRRRQPAQGWLWQEALENGHVWQKRFYDFVVRTDRKKVEKLNYMHNNPVKRGLVLEPGQWRWSSYRWYANGELGPVLVNEQQRAETKRVQRQTFAGSAATYPPFENRKGWGSRSFLSSTKPNQDLIWRTHLPD